MKTYRHNEIENKHGQYIAYWSKKKGNTELEKYKNFISNQTFNEFIIKDKNGLDMTCIVDTEEGPLVRICFDKNDLKLNEVIPFYGININRKFKINKLNNNYMKTTFKQFHPKVDKKRRLVLTRIYTGIKGSNNFCYRIDFINQKGDINKRVKPLYAFGNDDFSNVKEFKHAGNGEPTKVFKSAFKTVYGVSNKVDAINIWSKAN